MIVGQMQLRNFIMLKAFLTAVATGAAVLPFLNGFGIVKLATKAALYYTDIAGGLLLGTGIALAGACPGSPRETRRSACRLRVRFEWAEVAEAEQAVITKQVQEGAVLAPRPRPGSDHPVTVGAVIPAIYVVLRSGGGASFEGKSA